jgi:hypothetical protein
MTGHRIEFRLSENPWAPTAVIEEINERTNSGLVLVGLDEQTGGTSGAAYVRWPGGNDAVLTRTTTPLERMQQTAEVLASIRSKGLPVPRHDLTIPLADGYIAVVRTTCCTTRAAGSPESSTGISESRVATVISPSSNSATTWTTEQTSSPKPCSYSTIFCIKIKPGRSSCRVSNSP